MKTIKIPEELHKLLKVRAAEQGRGLQEIVEKVIWAGLSSLQPQPGPEEQQGDGKKNH